MAKTKRFKPTKFKLKESIYSQEHADFALNFIECLSHTKGTWSGEPFKLIDWQEQIIRDLFGVLKPDGYLLLYHYYSLVVMEKKELKFMVVLPIDSKPQ